MTERGRDWGAATRRSPSVPVPGDLLVASVALQCDAFDQSVVLVLDVNREGAIGVVLNRPTDTAVDEILPGWGPAASGPGYVSCGGPVSLDGALCLARVPHGQRPPHGWSRCFDDLGLLALDRDPASVVGRVTDLRVFVGYAGWGEGQLDEELEAGLWHVLPSARDDVFAEAPEELWRRVLRRVPGPLAYFCTWSADPELN